MPSHEITVEAILFDMDGTLVDSIAAVNQHYIEFCRSNGFEVSSHAHGVRTQDFMRGFFPQADDEEILKRARQYENDIVKTAQMLQAQGKRGLVILPGVERILADVRSCSDSEDRYAICTSATLEFTSEALKTVGITLPTHLVTAGDCQKGKPDPEPYLRGAKKLTKAASKCLVIEDAPAGIASGKAAGATVLAVCTSHTREQLLQTQADYIVDNLESVTVDVVKGSGYKISIRQ